MLLISVGIFLVIVLLVVILSYQVFAYLEQEVIFRPSHHHIWQPPSQVKSIYFKGPDGISQLHGWWLPGDSDQPVVLFCHGNTGNISHRRYVVELCQTLKIGLFIFDYRGYGKSSGRPSLSGIKDDGDMAYQQLLQRGYTSHQIIVWGESLGSGVAIHLAAKYSGRQLLLMAAYSDLSEVIRSSGKLIGKIAYPFLCFREVSNLNDMAMVRCPVFIAHSTEDEIIPYDQANQLYRITPSYRKVLVTLTGRHGSPHLEKDFFEKLLRFSWLSTEKSAECYRIIRKMELEISTETSAN